MANSVKVKCPKDKCQHEWWVSEEELEQSRIVFKSLSSVEEFSLKCPNCLEIVVIQLRKKA